MLKFSTAAQDKSIIYEFSAEVKQGISVKISLFACGLQEAWNSVNDLNQIFKERSVDDLTKCFAWPQYDVDARIYTLGDYPQCFANYQRFIQAQPFASAPEFSINKVTDLHSTYVGRRHNTEEMLVSFFSSEFSQDGECSFSFKKTNIIADKFPAYFDKTIKFNFGSNPNLEEVVVNYSNIVNCFILENEHEEDLVKLAMAQKAVDNELSCVFNGRVEWMPKLRIHYIMLNDFVQKRKAMWQRDINTDSTITPLMLTAARAGMRQLSRNVAINQIDSLIAQGVDVNAQDRYGRTALFYIAFTDLMFDEGYDPDRELMTKKLVDAGIDVKIKDVLGKTALDYYLLSDYSTHSGIPLLEEKLKASPAICPIN